MTDEVYIPQGRSEQAQAGQLIRQVGHSKFVGKGLFISVTTNLRTVVYAGTSPRLVSLTGSMKPSGAVKGSYIWTSGKVSGGAVRFQRLTNGTQSGLTFWYELVGY